MSFNRVSGTAVIMTGADETMVPASLMHHIACTHVLHEQVAFLSVIIADRPHVPAAESLEVETLGQGIQRIRVHYGFS